ncbi:hypothetical protein GCM10018790_03030 [Kitasatospora xanthocidica]|nr:hypothetical protein GCM10018790_03030 [Kitasatospora xanthocidica]
MGAGGAFEEGADGSAALDVAAGAGEGVGEQVGGAGGAGLGGEALVGVGVGQLFEFVADLGLSGDGPGAGPAGFAAGHGVVGLGEFAEQFGDLVGFGQEAGAGLAQVGADPFGDRARVDGAVRGVDQPRHQQPEFDQLPECRAVVHPDVRGAHAAAFAEDGEVERSGGRVREGGGEQGGGGFSGHRGRLASASRAGRGSGRRGGRAGGRCGRRRCVR